MAVTESCRAPRLPASEAARENVRHARHTLLAADGSFLAHVDLARLGVADRWADLAVMTMSFAWNYRDYDESVFWHAYGIAPDLDRIAFYRKLWDAE